MSNKIFNKKTLEEKRCDGKFEEMYEEIRQFSSNYNISLDNPRGSKKRKRETSSRLKDNVLFKPIGHAPDSDNDITHKEYWRARYYYRAIDVVSRLKIKFSEESLQIIESVDVLFPLSYEVA